MTTERRILADSNLNNLGGQNNNNLEDDAERKPSYVGLSCAVSGYSDLIRYSPSRKDSPPQKFQVNNEPQVLDYNHNMRQQTSPPVRGQESSNNGGDCDATDLS